MGSGIGFSERMTENEQNSVHAPVDCTGALSPAGREYSSVVLIARNLRREARATEITISVTAAIQEARLTNLPH
jgi:hypothetical protein